ncbi:MAG: hypothetical protein NZ870_03520, partial [bacterium]|nr:hypothetical protein [bacterium]
MIYVTLRSNIANSFSLASEVNRNLFGLLCIITGFHFRNEIKKIAQYVAIGGALASIYGILQKTGGVSIIEVPKMDRVMSF